jgi:hypothetical protein
VTSLALSRKLRRVGSLAVRWLLLPVAILGCREHPSPPPGGDLAPSTTPAPSGSGPRAAAGQPRRDTARPAPVGGKWLSCYGSFAPRSDPRLDVGRLGEACGPPNGMTKTKSFDGEVRADAGVPGHRFAARAGECFRVFAVADPAVEDLDLELFDAQGRRVAFDEGDDRWPIVKPDGPWCSFDAGELSIRVTASHGAGRYALEVWKLR